MSTVYDKNMVVAEETLDDKFVWYDVSKALLKSSISV